MQSNCKHNSNSETYNTFWQTNLETIDKITQKLEKKILELDNKSVKINNFFKELETEIDTLCSIYSCFNTFAGKGYILKLKAILTNQMQHFKSANMKFDTIYFLIEKINALRNNNFENFPVLKHFDTKTPETIPEKTIESPTNVIKWNHENAAFKWISFKRNGSWFIIPYNTKLYIQAKFAEYNTDNKDNPFILYNNTKYQVTDLFAKANTIYKSEAKIFICLNNKSECFSADKIGKVFISNKNFISMKTKKFNINSSLAEGYIKFCGKRYILLKSCD